MRPNPSQGQYEGVCDIQMRELVLFGPFRYLRGGRLFCFASASGTESWTHGMPYRWLCSECSTTMTLDLDERGEVALLLFAG